MTMALPSELLDYGAIYDRLLITTNRRVTENILCTATRVGTSACHSRASAGLRQELHGQDTSLSNECAHSSMVGYLAALR